MEHTTRAAHTKRRVIIFIVLLAAFLLIGLTTSAPKPASLVPSIVSERSCYVWNTDNGDLATIVLTTAGESAAGTIAVLPAEKDKKTGDFTATVSNPTPETAVIHGWWNTIAEGVTVKEEVIITTDTSTAAVGFGEMKAQADGSYVYADTEALSFTPVLQKTDCSNLTL
jgi:hypothetical protein